MLFCETANLGAQAVEDLAVFVSQLNAVGVVARVDARSVPEGLHRNTQFDLAPFLIDRPPTAEDQVVLVAAERLTDPRLVDLRRLVGRSGARCLAIGAFATHQTRVGVTAKLSYVFGRVPELLALPSDDGLHHDARSGCPIFGAPGPGADGETPGLLLLGPALDELAQGRALTSLALLRDVRVAVLTDGKAKQRWIEASGTGVAIFQYGECLPVSLAARTRICVLFPGPAASYRVQSLVANLAVRGAALVDGTQSRAYAGRSDGFVVGPVDLTTVANFLQTEILPNLAAISEQVRGSKLARRCASEPVLRFLDATPAPPPRRRAGARPGRVVFMPTNGIGLGHTQRASLVAAELGGGLRPVFAAFPSCMRLIKSYGFDVAPLIGRSEQHAQSHENDLANYLRLRALAAGARALVFDGIYVFDSVYRSILDHRLAGVWIRRGLWQLGQNNTTALDREKVFARVIVPSEAFEELNGSYSLGAHVRTVGPIVQQQALGPDARAALRARLAERFERPFDRLVVSLLGAGIAADRSAQIQAICGMMQRRSDVLHLVVVWPTAVLQPAWFAWSNSRVVRTSRAALLVAAADLCVSAAGYNSFHEILYAGTPAIFVPQMQAFMDDQRARARAASERGLAAVVEATQLMTLEREVGRLLEGGGAEAVRRFAALDLPAPGNRAAAALIEEVANGRATLDIGARSRQRARRG